jgi:hypothetical protein
LLVVIVGLAMTGCSSSDSSGQSDTTGQSSGDAGPPDGLGLGSAAALAQSTCNPNGHTSFVNVGAGPFCVNPWPAGSDNGGETAPGVTADEVKVVFYVPTAAMLEGATSAGGRAPSNQGTGQPATYEQVVNDFDEVYQYAIEQSGTYQTWGRKPVYEFVEATGPTTGPDEASQRADALEVIAKKPFMVVDAFTGGMPVFAATVAAEKIVVVSSSTDAENAAKQRPYRWAAGQDSDAAAYLTASFLGSTLSGKEAQWAGDSAMTSQTRTFGAVHPATGIDIDTFKKLLDENNATALASDVEYDNKDATKYQEAAPTLVSKLKDAGVTSVVLFADPTMTTALMAAATKQDYHPEWIVTGFLFHDFDGYARQNDQEQMAHAFGIGTLPPAYEGSASSTGIFQWYWGTDQGNFDQATQGGMSVIYAAIMYAGPTLTAENIEKGLFSVPGVGGSFDGTTNFQYGFGKTVGLPYDEYALLGTDRNLAWWNPDLSGGANAYPTLVGQGKFEYLNDATRYGYGQFPADAKFFDQASSVSEIPRSSSFAGGQVPADNPCTGCPVNGGTG